MSDFHTMVHWFQAAAALVAAVLWSKSAAIKVPNNIDAVPDLQRIGFWNAWAAGWSCLTGLFGSAGWIYTLVMTSSLRPATPLQSIKGQHQSSRQP